MDRSSVGLAAGAAILKIDTWNYKRNVVESEDWTRSKQTELGMVQIKNPSKLQISDISKTSDKNNFCPDFGHFGLTF